MTQVGSNPSPGQYSFAENSGALVVAPTISPLTTNVLIAFYYLFYTTDRVQTIGTDPEDSTTDTRDWESKVITSPGVNQSIENQFEGFLSINSSQLEIINDGNDFGAYLGRYDSFNNKEVRIWNCLDEVSNIQKAFIGKVTGLNVSPRKITLKIEDNFSAIKEPATMGDSKEFSYWNLQDYSNMYKESNNTPVRFFVGSVSRYKTIRSTGHGIEDALRLEPESLNKAVCTNFNSSIGTTVNRTWGIGRVPSTGINQRVHSIQTYSQQDVDHTRFTIATHSEIFIGDTGHVTSILAPGTDYFRVVKVDSANSYVYTQKLSVYSFTHFHTHGVDMVVEQNTEDNNYDFYPMPSRDFTVQKASTDSGNSYISVTFSNGFESNLTSMTALDPTQHKVYFKIKPNYTEQTHGKILKYILQKVGGFTLNDASFTTADTDLVTNVNFSIPRFQELDYHPYHKYIGDILESTLGFIKINRDFELEYKISSALVSTGTEISDIDITKDSFSAEVDYDDIITGIVAENPHYLASEHASLSSTGTDSPVSRFLHGVTRNIRFEHVLESVATSIRRIFSIRKERRVTYDFETETVNLDSVLGDDFLLSYNTISGDSTAPIRLTGIDRKAAGSKILASDFLGH